MIINSFEKVDMLNQIKTLHSVHMYQTISWYSIDIANVYNVMYQLRNKKNLYGIYARWYMPVIPAHGEHGEAV